MRETAPNQWPALTASAALHAALLAATLITWPWWSRPVELSNVVPVTLVTSDKPLEMRPAVAAPTPEPPAAETPVPEAKPEPPSNPAPAPVKSAPTKPAPTPTKQPAKLTPSEFDPDVVLAKLHTPSNLKPSPGSGGRPRPGPAPDLNTGRGDAENAAAVNSLRAAIIPHWNLSCDTPRNLDIQVAFRLNRSGRLVEPPRSPGDDAPRFSALRVASEAAERAVLAAVAAAPFENLPPSFYSQPITLKFNVQAALEQEGCG
jgi:hypothetical protein